jgi:hypothetical protein
MEKELSSDIEQSKAFITLVEKKLKPALVSYLKSVDHSY